MATSLPLLLIEADPALVHILKATLRYGGYESESAPTGLEALSRIGSSAYAAVLLDLGMPDVGGSRLVKMVRGLTGVPILVVSGAADQEETIAVLDAGADDFIEKPFLPGELLARIRAALRRSGGDPMPETAARQSAGGAG